MTHDFFIVTPLKYIFVKILIFFGPTIRTRQEIQCPLYAEFLVLSVQFFNIYYLVLAFRCFFKVQFSVLCFQCKLLSTYLVFSVQCSVFRVQCSVYSAIKLIKYKMHNINLEIQ